MKYSLRKDSVSFEVEIPFSTYMNLTKLSQGNSLSKVIVSLCNQKIQEMINKEGDNELWYENWNV